jgi:murein DD-endopeptidase MepM/ murein hydrolase activator NlpD
MFFPPRRRIGPSLLAALVALTALLALSVAGSAVATDRGTMWAPVPPGPWGWPLPAPHVVVAPFAPPAEPWLPGQRGVVLAGHRGEAVLAAGAGVIGYAGTIGAAHVVTVVHGTLRTTYEPVAAAVHRGQQVALGAVLGRLLTAGTECPPRACLHWGLLRGATYLDPLSLVMAAEVRLLPVEPDH